MEHANFTELRKFVETFFKNLGCRISEDEGILVVEKVPKDFEEVCGKKSPYRLRFTNEGNSNSDFITKGSTFLKSMMNYMDQKGQTTLVKLTFDRDFKEQIEHYFSFRNCEISSFTKKANFKPFVRFSIATTLQYLNEREQITNQICVYDGKVIDFNLDRYPHVSGSKSEIGKLDFKGEYELAKEELKGLVKRRVEETAKVLSDKLDKEIERVKSHYVKQKHEIRENEIKLNVQKQKLQEELKKATDDEWRHIQSRIKKINHSLKELSAKETFEKMKTEEDFFVNDEKQKHSLKIKNKLINTAIIYYPIFTFEFYVKSGKATKRLELVYEPFLDAIEKTIACESCEREIRDIYLCSSGHVSCTSCIERCSVCNSTLCVSCSKKHCEMCGKKLCKDCVQRCGSCHRLICKLHLHTDFTDAKEYCEHCLVKCESCGKFTRRKNIRKSGERDICEKCYRLSGLKMGPRNF